MLKATIAATAQGGFGRVLAMPNTNPPILTGEDAVSYRHEITSLMQLPCPARHLDFEVLTTIKIAPSTTPEVVRTAFRAGVVAGKLYPDGVTTNSEDGVRDFMALSAVFAEMEQVGMVLCLHGEMPGVFSLDREKAFLPIVETIATRFPKLRIVLEHVSSEDAIDAIGRLSDSVAATITVHHLLLTLDDLVGDLLNPHHFCKPVVKRPEDREALRRAAMSGNRRFFLGTDSAPHRRTAKESGRGAAGVFTAPVAVPLLAQLFEAYGALDRLEQFTSVNGAAFYGVRRSSRTIRLVRKPYRHATFDELVTFHSEKPIEWRIELES